MSVDHHDQDKYPLLSVPYYKLKEGKLFINLTELYATPFMEFLTPKSQFINYGKRDNSYFVASNIKSKINTIGIPKVYTSKLTHERKFQNSVFVI